MLLSTHAALEPRYITWCAAQQEQQQHPHGAGDGHAAVPATAVQAQVSVQLVRDEDMAA